ncbi:ABC transporter permease subunit [Plantactinospora soyae]|uniref:ABC-type transport system involved in multi-copper enzyme maturation permease subunit n=1 Tax=Plantactinospora soyae TaxID=1544732 RepID=A0A927MCU1_9ACTN|nr:ABC transporter permease subunit [Plantactinospora soyae]MBE1491397.1 ABC-type transport system involved in multi-copper enzyme maturation permease subunit [Plantactinospora soyae]
MIWMSWRQFRTQAVVGAVALTVLAICLVILGMQLRHSYDAALALCQGRGDGCAGVMNEFSQRYSTRLYLLDGLLIVVPGILGTFWGAPLVARELEAGTHRLVWNQSLTRRRWLAVKLLVVGVAAMAVTGLFSLLLTWAASPYDQVTGDRFTGLLFGTRNLVPVAYAAFAVVLGAILGLTIRRTVPAMALTIVVFAVAQIAMPMLIRPHLLPPVSVTQPMTAETVRNLSSMKADATVRGVQIPGAWVVSHGELLTSNGEPVEPTRYHECVLLGPDAVPECLAGLDLHVEGAYQPADRYWSFQWLEAAIFLALGGLLLGLGLWRIQGRFR